MEILRNINNDGTMISYGDAGELLCVSYATVVAMYKKGMDTIAEMEEYRRKLDAGELFRGGKTSIIYKTTRGEMTVVEMEHIHPADLTRETIYNRGVKWGFDHLCLWFDKSKGWGEFHRVAIEADGPPRGVDPEDDEQSEAYYDMPEFNRTKVCLRNHGREKCRHYEGRLDWNGEYPEPCLCAENDYCSSYDGVVVEVRVNSSGRSPRHYSKNGTSTESV